MKRTATYQALIQAQWKHQRTEIAMLAILATITPSVIVWYTSRWDGSVYQIMQTADAIGILGPILAIVTGLLLAVRPYALDARSRHTYALSLPISRAEFAMQRAAAGLTLIAVPTAGFLIGSLLAVQALPPSSVFNAYPIGLSIRFLLAGALAFAAGFGLQYGLGGRAGRWVVIVGVTIIAFEVFGQLTFRSSLTAPLWEFLAGRASPLQIFISRWTLFDV